MQGDKMYLKALKSGLLILNEDVEVQAGMNVNTNTLQIGLGCNFDIGTTHAIANKSHLKKKIA